MSPDPSVPAFDEFLRFVATHYGSFRIGASPPDRLLAAARSARKALQALHPQDRTPRSSDPPAAGDAEVLELLAASSEGAPAPSERVTGRGFRVRLDYRDGTYAEASSICVLIQCPPDLIAWVQGKRACLWSGTERFELGEFDVDGKAIGTLPAGIEITLADFAAGRVKLEAPDAMQDD